MKVLVIILLVCLYLTLPPIWFVEYGLANNVEGFSNSTPFYEIYSIVCAAWMALNCLVAFMALCLYMIFRRG